MEAMLKTLANLAEVLQQPASRKPSSLEALPALSGWETASLAAKRPDISRRRRRSDPAPSGRPAAGTRYRGPAHYGCVTVVNDHTSPAVVPPSFLESMRQ